MPQVPTSTRLRYIGHLLERLFDGLPNDLGRSGRFAGYMLAIAVAVFLSLYMSAGLSKGQWSVYADHELRAYRIAYPHLSIVELPSLLSKTVAGYPGKLTRYNPVNYAFMQLTTTFFA